MAVLIVFETVEGQTGRIVERVAERARSRDLEVRMLDTGGAEAATNFSGVERVVLAAPVHERRHPPGFEAFLRTYRAELAARPTLMLSVSLSAAFPELLEEAQDYLTEMEMRTGFTAAMSELVAGAVRPAGYDYFQSMVVRNVVLRGHGSGPEDGEQEFTDWAALEKTVDGFLAGS